MRLCLCSAKCKEKMRNFRGNCLSQLVILLQVWLVSRLSELFFTPYSLEILVIVNPYQNVTVLSAKRDHLSHERTRGHTTKTQRKWEKLCHKQPRLENFNQNFSRENWTLKNRELFGWIAIILFDRGWGGRGRGEGARAKEYLEITVDESRGLKV